jgi:hypothetical protein
MPANRPHRPRNFFPPEEKNSADTTNDKKYILGGVIAVGFGFLGASSNAQAKEMKINEALTIMEPNRVGRWS